ncbi:hypothetical protein [Bradyrhizobium uaiense]|uniref:hypothetical protein n=1 Tax=Bradyrhizobium uaiense TaxID=2594946 RepID=UPI0013D13921|nr:hypothetical protein [Bradyrhizobium uaiense]
MEVHASIVAAAVGKGFIGGNDVLEAVFARALAIGSVLALLTHAVIPAAQEGGLPAERPMVASFPYLCSISPSPSLWFELTSAMVSSGIAATGIGLHSTLAKSNDTQRRRVQHAGSHSRCSNQ